MNVLAIGNSFSVDATRYLHDIAKAAGEELEVTNLYVGGCSLERHYRNMLTNKHEYHLQYNGHLTGFYISQDDALFSRQWDIITLQQASPRSFDADTYTPYIFELVEHIRKIQPKAKIVIHQTWAYEDGSVRLANTGYATAEAMRADIIKAYAQIAEQIHADGIIPSGELFGELLKQGVEQIHRDTYHAKLGIGRYALGLLWCRMLTGASVADNTFAAFDEEISEEYVQLAKRCVDAVTPLFTE